MRTPKNLILNTSSLSLTLWTLEQMRFKGFTPPQKELDKTLDWIIKRQKDPARYGLGFAAPTERDFESASLPTGEKLTSRASTAHILGEEAFWALSKWRGPQTTGIIEGISGILGRAKLYPMHADKGRYCCAKCSLAFWRAIFASGHKEGMKFLDRGLYFMKSSRDTKFGWQAFPFAYTIFTLATLDHPLADKEIIYSAMRIEKELKSLKPEQDPFGLKRAGFETALNKV